MAFGNDWDDEKMLCLYIYNDMKKKGHHDVADKFAKEENLNMFELVDSEEGLLTEWWESFWPRFCSRLANIARGNSQSFPQPSMQDCTPVTNLQMVAGGGSNEVNVIGQRPVSVLPTPPGISQRRAVKRPVNTDTYSILAQSAASFFRKGPQLTRFNGGLSEFLKNGEDNRKSQMPLPGVGVSDGLDATSYKSRVPDAFLQFMHREVQAHHAANPQIKKTIQEVLIGSETAGIRRDYDNVRIESPGEGVTGWNGPNSASTTDVEEENETEGENNQVWDEKRGTGQRRNN